tara:strand:+ start:1259 stop:1456 length:198 start_codon:yes stop_codon:yes gene_type:complete
MLFEIKGSKAITIRVNKKEHTEYVDQWFKCEYDASTKKAYFLRKGGVRGAQVQDLPKALVANLTK